MALIRKDASAMPIGWGASREARTHTHVKLSLRHGLTTCNMFNRWQTPASQEKLCEL